MPWDLARSDERELGASRGGARPHVRRLIANRLFGGADFGAGIWNLLVGGTRRGRRQRELIEHSLGPAWKANHVSLILVR
jgi:hypothetical protein